MRVNPFDFGLLQRMRSFFSGSGDIRECLDHTETAAEPDSLLDWLWNDGLTAEYYLKAALAHMEGRAVTYDSPGGERSMGKTVEMFNAYSGLKLTEEQGWIFMALLKIVRSSQGKFKSDNFEDLAAYAGLAGEAAAKAFNQQI